MSRRIPEREPSPVGSVQLRRACGAQVSAPVAARATLASALAAALPAPDRARADSGPGEPEELDEQWRAHLAAPTRRGRDRLAERYAPLLRAIAHRVAAGLPAHVDVADLVQAGAFGLLDAIERFDPQRCARFEAFAAQRIRGAILDDLRAQDWVPRTVRGRLRECDRVRERLEGRLQRAATDSEIAAEMGLDVPAVRALTRQVQVLSVEELAEVGGGVADLLEGAEPDPVTVVQARELMRGLNAAVAGLGERDRRVVQLYYLEGRTLAEIGRVLGVTESRVCQLHSRLVGRLRGQLEELTAG